MVILKRWCESLESEVQSQKRLRHGLGEVFHQQGFEAGWTENQIGRLMLHMSRQPVGLTILSRTFRWLSCWTLL